MPNKRKRKRPAAAAASDGGGDWKPVNVGLLKPSLAAGATSKQDDDNFETTDNHYDTPSSQTYRKADKELEADPAEGVGFFFGLEVLDGSQYSVVEDDDGRKQMVFHDSTSAVAKEAREKKEGIKQANLKGNQNVEEKSSQNSTKAKEVPAEKKTKSKEKKQVKKPNKNESGQISSKDVDEGKKSKLGPLDEAVSKEDSQSKKKKKKSKKKKKEKEKKATASAAEDINSDPKSEQPSTPENNAQAISLQTSWMTATGGVSLQEALCKALLAQGFWNPTPIQAASLPAAILGRRNIVGAAPTGSGKTLAYLLPILEYLLQKEEDDKLERKLHALICCPTRELCLQVQKECNKLVIGKCGVLVGGLAPQKQERVLRRNRPPIIIATPGRLWELVSSRDHEHLNDMTQIAFLVIDECDRMTEQGSFPQLHRILDAVEKANPMDSDDEEDDEENVDEGDDDYDPDRLLSLPGVKGEAKVVMLNDDILAQVEKQRNGEQGEIPQPVEESDDDYVSEEDNEIEADEEVDIGEDALPERPPVHRQTFVYSATLTLPPSASFIPSRNRKRKVHSLKGIEGAIEEILEKARARGQTKVIDLSNSRKQAKFNEKILETKDRVTAKEATAAEPPLRRSFNLPPGLKLQEIQCTQMHKDSHLYAYLVTTREGASGPCLVFCNSIKAVRRVGKTLQALGLPVRILHANMEQRARFKAVESLQSGGRAVVVATDIAARGLDIPNVASVVHYDLARKVDGFVHRAGRTARGMGEKAVGSSLSLISPAEDRAHRKIADELNVKFAHVHLDSRLLASAQERTNLASKVIAAEEVEGKAKRNNQWFIDSAKEVGLELDDDVMDEGLAGGDRREQQQLHEAKRAKGLLRKLLQEPLVTQRFGKFLSSNSAAAKADVAPFIVKPASMRLKKKRKKKN